MAGINQYTGGRTALMAAFQAANAVRESYNFAGFKSLPLRQRYLFTSYWFDTDKQTMRSTLENKWPLKYRNVHSTGSILPLEERSYSQGVESLELTWTWVKCLSTDLTGEHDIEVIKDKANRIYELITTNMNSMYETHHAFLEAAAKGMPTLDSDPRIARGIFYGLPPITTTQLTANLAAGTGTGAFQGIHGYGMSAWNGVSRSTYSELKSWNDSWASNAGITCVDDLKKFALACNRLMVFAPADVSGLVNPQVSRFLFATDRTNLEALSDMAQAGYQDMNGNLSKGLGMGLGRDGDPQFMGHHIFEDEDLNTASLAVRGYHPLVCVNREEYIPVFNETYYFMKRLNMDGGAPLPDARFNSIETEYQFVPKTGKYDGFLLSYPSV